MDMKFDGFDDFKNHMDKDELLKILATPRLYSTGSCKYFPIHAFEINLQKLDPVYRKEVMGVAPPLYENQELRERLKDILGTERPNLVSAQSRAMFPWREPMGYEDDTISIEKVLEFFEDSAHDAFLTDILVYRGVEWENKKIKPLDSYLFRLVGDAGEGEEKRDFGILELKAND